MYKNKVVIPIQILAQYYQRRLSKELHMKTQAVYSLPKMSMIWLTHKQSESQVFLLSQMHQLYNHKDLRYEMLRDNTKANQSSSESKLILSPQMYKQRIACVLLTLTHTALVTYLDQTAADDKQIEIKESNCYNQQLSWILQTRFSSKNVSQKELQWLTRTHKVHRTISISWKFNNKLVN